MVFIPNLKKYDINCLVALGNQAVDEFVRERIKLVIIEKINLLNYPTFALIHKLKKSNNILKEVYASLIMMRLSTEDYSIDDSMIDEIVDLVSLDILIYYGAYSPSLKFREKCIQKFWNIVEMLEDKEMLEQKKYIDCRRIRVLKIRGDKE